MHPRMLLLSLCSATVVVGVAGAQRPAAAPGGGGRGAAQTADTQGVPAVEKVSTTHHTTRINGKEIAYTARVGTMVLRDDDGQPKASVFYISYTRDGVDSVKRPVTFFFNGGPGSASIWLSMGIMSPMAPQMGPGGAQPAPPYNLTENPYSPLDATDLVQVDAMNTGWSRPAKGVNVTNFTGASNDIQMFADFIGEYLDKYGRWQSPKYLFGESYGTFRSAGLASALQGAGITLNGIMLLGTVLNFQYISPSPTNDIGYPAFLPTYTATAWYHKKLPADLQKESLEQVVQESRTYAFGDYLASLTKGNKLTDAEIASTADRLARLTGLSTTFIRNTNLRIDPGSFRTELLRDRRLTVGRYDSRMTGINGNASSLFQDYDPSDVAPTGAFVSAFKRYLHDELNYSNPLEYYVGGRTGRWEYPQGSYPNQTESLRRAMAQNPYLKVMVASGYYDMATPFGNAEYNFDHLGFGKTYRDRVEYKYYESGHMAYLNQESAGQLRDDIAAFIKATMSPQTITPAR